MTRQIGLKPLVLRCSRCGKMMDWQDARLQVVDGCRPHLDLAPVIVRESQVTDQPLVFDMLVRDFGHTTIVDFGEQLALEHVSAIALIAEMKGELAGVLAYRMRPEALHIVALATDPLWQRSGVGSQLVQEAEQLARRKGFGRVAVGTTNDNLPSLYFYQRRGYVIDECVPRALLINGNPESPGFGGIPMRDEIRLHKSLTS